MGGEKEAIEPGMNENPNRFIRTLKKLRKSLIVVAVLAVAVIAGAVYWNKSADAGNFITGKAENGSVEVTVSATGTVQAVTTVLVGSQVSGTVAWLGADFNSRVSRGEVIARLDSTTFEAQVENARANVANAEAAVQVSTSEINSQTANLQSARANEEVSRVQRDDAAALVDRYRELKNVVPAREIESAQAQANAAEGRLAQAKAQVSQVEASLQTSRARLEQARAQLGQARAQLEQSLANLSHTVIASPIDGVVVSRSVDVGQTVAASLQAPTLFTIANDLTKMQVLAAVDEADVGQIRENMKANFTVDAFPRDTFTGTVSQIRLDAQALQNVVTYTAVIQVSNPEMKLRPGMTTTITFQIARRDDVLVVPNAALRFSPTLSEKEQEELMSAMQAAREQRARAREDIPVADGPRRGRRGNSVDGAGANSSENAGEQVQMQRQPETPVWVLGEGGKLAPRFVRTGLTDGRVTEVVAGNLEPGEMIVIGQTDAAAPAAQQQASPFGQRPGMRGAPTRGRTR